MSEDRFKDWQYPKIEHGKLTKYNWLVYHPDKLKLGYKTDIGAFCVLMAHEGIEIGDYVELGSHVSIYSLNTIDNKRGKVVLKKNSKIGSHSTIMPGVIVGQNTIIGAHSFVNKSIPDNVIAWGVPAKVRRRLYE